MNSSSNSEYRKPFVIITVIMNACELFENFELEIIFVGRG
jgi:hypothetical protein